MYSFLLGFAKNPNDVWIFSVFYFFVCNGSSQITSIVSVTSVSSLVVQSHFFRHGRPAC